MSNAKATIQLGSTGIWCALIAWPFGYRFVSGPDLQSLCNRIDSVSRAIGRQVDVVRQ